MHKILLGLCLTLTSLTVLSGCGPHPQPQAAVKPAYNQQVANFYPLAVGHKWSYKGSIIGIATERTVQITALENGYYLDNSGGALKIDDFGLRDSSGRYLLRGPLAKGTSWMSVPSVSAVERYEIIAEGKTVTTPAGTFNACLIVKATNKLSSGDTMVAQTTFAPKVGIIRIQTMIVSKGITIPQTDLLLTDYSTY